LLTEASEPTRQIAERAPERFSQVLFVEWGWRPLGAPAGLLFEFSRSGIGMALSNLLNPWVDRVRAGVAPAESGILPKLFGPGQLLGILWLQLANAAFSELQPRLCAFDRCPGPPARPGVFLWRWGRTASGIKHRDSICCHPLCQHAAAVDKARKTNPEYQRDQRRRKRREGM